MARPPRRPRATSISRAAAPIRPSVGRSHRSARQVDASPARMPPNGAKPPLHAASLASAAVRTVRHLVSAKPSLPLPERRPPPPARLHHRRRTEVRHHVAVDVSQRASQRRPADDEGDELLRRQFPSRDPLVPHALPAGSRHEPRRREGEQKLTGESSAYYMFHPLAAVRIAETLPARKLSCCSAIPSAARSPTIN